ncbi:MAG TPA: Xaa-Pro dipeptidase [Steroidobacteraceae bacterium]
MNGRDNHVDDPMAEPMTAAMPDLRIAYANHLASLQVRFSSALEASGHEAALVYSGLLLPVFRDDQSYPFRPQAWFSIWGPLPPAPDCFVYVKPGSRPKLLICAPPDFWYEQATIPTGDWTGHFEIQLVASLAEARAALPQNLARVALLGEPCPEITTWGFAALNPEKLLLALDFTRAVKTPYELSRLRLANRLGARGHVAAAAAFAAGNSEFRIHQAFLQAIGQREQELPYNAIVALNEAGSVLHYQNLKREPPAAHHSLLIDAGAQCAGYGSDITRTWATAGGSGVVQDFAALITAMDQAQQSLCAQVRAGVEWTAIHLAAHRAVAGVLRDSDLIDCDADAALATGLSSVFLPHGIGHLLGLQVHDVGGLQRSAAGGEIPRPAGHPYLRLTRRLEAGFVVTMEPGLYFIEQLLAQARADGRGKHINWRRVASLRACGGIRIEDDLAVTASGCENLTRDAFAHAALPA